MSAQAEPGFLSERLASVANELEDVRLKLKQMSGRLGEAEGALRYYANPANFEATRILEGKTVYQDRLKRDHSTADNDKNVHIAGMRAREYFKRYETE